MLPFKEGSLSGEKPEFENQESEKPTIIENLQDLRDLASYDAHKLAIKSYGGDEATKNAFGKILKEKEYVFAVLDNAINEGRLLDDLIKDLKEHVATETDPQVFKNARSALEFIESSLSKPFPMDAFKAIQEARAEKGNQ